MSEPKRIHDSAKLMHSVIRVLAGHRPKEERHGTPLWKAVSTLTTNGKTYSQEICEQFGFDPDLLVNEPEFVDASFQAVVCVCLTCFDYYDPEQGKDCDCDEEDNEDEQ